VNVAVTGVGGGVGQSIIKALQDSEYQTVGIDSEVLAAGLYATKSSYLGLKATDPSYVDRLIEICDKERCKALFPGLDVELIPLCEGQHKLKQNGITPIVSNSEVLEIADDKLRTQSFLHENGFLHARTYNLDEYDSELGFPMILKPKRGGARSVGVITVRDKEDFDSSVRHIDRSNYVAQEYIEGDEYTCGTVSLNNGCVGVILMRRQLRFGDTYKAFVENNPELATYVKRVVDRLGPFGPCNVQMRVRDGKPYIFEFNARCSGTTAGRSLAGFNEPKMVCDYIFKGIDRPSFDIKEIAILRYWKELVVESSDIQEMRLNRRLEHEATRL
jgi:carbamoyl-phosphate synthase large subunit